MQAMEPYESSLLEGSVRVASDGKALEQQFDPRREFTFEVEAEIGEVGLRFETPYKGLKIEVDAVLNQEKEDYELERALVMCDSGSALLPFTAVCTFEELCICARMI